ncbi:MAG: hypothetical protein MUE73_02600 [Planctomycetes bacterium]|jgi:hypothetical protein|nr:hypothetical protein [Planctomycetota bacterium]
MERLVRGACLALLLVLTRGSEAKPPPDNPIHASLAGTEIARGREYRALLVVPLLAPAADPENARPLASAAASAGADLFNPAEPAKSEGRSTIEFLNWSTEPVLVLAGTILSGGARDRFVPGSHLVGPASRILARVYPADREARKPADRGRILEPEALVVPHLLRVLGLGGGSLAAVDGFLEEVHALSGIRPDRQPIATLYRLGPIAEKMQEYLPYFAGVPGEADGRAVGAAIYVGDRFLSVDLFGRNADFRVFWPALLASAAFEAAAYEVSYGLLNAPFPAARDPERAREDLTRILRRPLGASHREEKVTGLGREFAFRRDDLTGRTLALDGQLVHAMILKDVLSEPEPEPPAAGTPSEETYGDLARRAERSRLTEFERRLLDRMRDRRGIPAGE